jgi:serine protease Do
MVGMTKIGETAKLKVLREGAYKELVVKIGALPTDDDEPVLAKGELEGQLVSRLGVRVANLTADMREQLEVTKFGVLVTDVVQRSPAFEAGLRKGDVIQRLQDQSVKDVSHLQDLAKGLVKGKTVAVLVLRGGNSLFLPLKIKE